MEREFKVSIGMKIFYFVIAIFMIGFAFYLFSIPGNEYNAVLILPAMILGGGILTIFAQLRRKITFNSECIVKTGIFKTTQINLEDIKGVRVGDKVITIESKLTPPSKLTIGNYIDYSDSDEFKQYLLTHYVDLNDVDYKTELKDILSDSNLGLTEDDRKAKLKKAQYIAWSYNGLSLICAVAGLIWDNNSSLLLLLLYPFFAILIIKSSNKLIRFVPNTKSPYYTVLLGVMIPSIVSLILATKKYDIYQFSNLWIPVVIVIGVFGTLFYLIDKSNEIVPVKGRVFLTIMLAMVYGFGCVINTNCSFDNSSEQIYHANVLEHRVSYGKSTDYFLTLGPWGPQATPQEVSVSAYMYDHTNIGTTVTVHFRNGLLNAPWLTVSD